MKASIRRPGVEKVTGWAGGDGMMTRLARIAGLARLVARYSEKAFKSKESPSISLLRACYNGESARELPPALALECLYVMGDAKLDEASLDDLEDKGLMRYNDYLIAVEKRERLEASKKQDEERAARAKALEERRRNAVSPNHGKTKHYSDSHSDSVAYARRGDTMAYDIDEETQDEMYARIERKAMQEGYDSYVHVPSWYSGFIERAYPTDEWRRREREREEYFENGGL